jgi:hypothetical protein
MKSNRTKEEWKNHLENQKKSGLSIRAYCQGQGLNHHTFRYHKDRIGKVSQPKRVTKAAFLELKESQSPGRESKEFGFFLQIKIGEVVNCEIKLG